MTILVVIHNSELAAEIASFLSRESMRTVVCPSVSSPPFLKEFPAAGLLITDLAPAVLELLQVQGQRLLLSGVPLVVLASPGHCSSFAALLADTRAACVAIDHDGGFLERLRGAVTSLVQQQPAREAIPTTAARPCDAESEAIAPTTGAIPSKHMVADQAHQRRPSHHSRRLRHRSDRLISDIAHDLRTPLTAVCEFASLMESGIAGPMTEQQRRYLGIIERRCQEAARMTDDLLDGAKLQSGRVHLHRQAVALDVVTTELRESLAPAIRHSEVNLSVEVPDGMPRVFADRDMLGRILSNLVSNAIKFSAPGGPIIVRAVRHSVSMARVSVIDSGSGISPEELRRIFRRFEQGSNCTSGGVGLGLAIVRQLVRLHGGRVTAESAPGKGSRFHFSLPMFLPVAIVRRHLANLAGKPVPQAAAFAFICQEPTHYDAIHRFVTSVVRARDLVLPEDDRRRLLLITQAKNPERLVERLRSQIEARAVAVPEIQRLHTTELKRWLENGAPAFPPRGTQSDTAPLAG